MRVGVNCYLLQPNIGGLKQYFLTLFRELLEQDHDNEYIFFWYRHNADELAHLGTDRWKEKAVRLDDQRQVLDYLDRIDLYFCPFSALYPRPLPLPTVMTLVDIQEVFFPEFFTAQDLYNRALHFPISTRLSDRVMTISKFSKRTLMKHHYLPEHKVIVAYLSADERYARSEHIARPPHVSLPNSFLFYPANFWKHKNHEHLLQAMRLLRDERGLCVNLVCTGSEVSNGYPLAAKIAEYGLSAQILILGYLTVEEVAYLYRQARMLVFPSLFEGFGLPLVEAMSAGCPVIAANSTSIPEVCGDAAEFFDPRSSADVARVIERVWCDQTLRQSLITRGRHRAQAFSPTRTAKIHQLAFEEARAAFSPRRHGWRRLQNLTHRVSVDLRWGKAWHSTWRARLRRRFPHVTNPSSDHLIPIEGDRALGYYWFEKGWHAVERNDQAWWRWTSGRGRIHIVTTKELRVVLCGEVYSIVHPNKVDVLVNGQRLTTLYVTGDRFEAFAAITLHLLAGKTRLEFVSHQRAVQTRADCRPLAVAVRNLELVGQEPC